MSHIRRFTTQIRCRISVSDELMQAIHEKRCTTLIIKQGQKRLHVGDKLEINSPMGLRDDVLIRHIETESAAIQPGYCVLSIIPEDMIPIDSWHLIRELRGELALMQAHQRAVA